MTTKRKILFCIYSLTNGGAEKLLIDLLRELDQSLFVIDLCILTNKGLYIEDVPEQVKLINYKQFCLGEYDVEVAFSQGLSTKEIAFRKSSAVKIAWVHSDLFAAPTSGAYTYDGEEELCYSILDQIIFVSKTAMQQFCRKFPGIKVKKSVIYNLVNKQEIINKSRGHVEKAKLTLCSIGRLVPVKGFVRLIPLLAKLKKEGMDFHYWILGDGSQEVVIRDLIGQYDLEDTVYLMGFRKNPHPYLRASDIFVSASFYEGFSLVTAEAMCLSKPVLATNVSGTAELLGYGKYGMLVDADDESVYEGLRKMISDETLRASYSRKARNGLKTNLFNYKKNLDRVNQLLYSVQSTKTPLERIAGILMADNIKNHYIGLLYGKMGKVIFLFHYARFTGDKLYENCAMQLIEEIRKEIQRNVTVVSYRNGLAGIGTGFEYLAQNQFINDETNELLSEFDEILSKVVFNRSHLDFTLLDGYIGFSRYWMFRLCNKNNIEGRNTLMVKVLDKIFQIINDTSVLKNVRNDELMDIYRFLCDIKQFPQFIIPVEGILNNKEVKERIKNSCPRFNYLEGEVGERIRECIILKYFEVPVASCSGNTQIIYNDKPFLLNGLIANGLFLISLQNHDWGWINLL